MAVVNFALNDFNHPLTIGQVLALLRPEFPDLTSSKLRFLEDRKLIAPSRTSAGYRKFYARDVDRLRQILSLQRDQYLPLKVIRARLEEDRKADSKSPKAVKTLARRLRREELLELTQASSLLFTEAVTASLIEPSEYYDQEAVSVMLILARLRRHGIMPRHLAALRNAVDRNLSLVQNVLKPLLAKKNPNPNLMEAAVADMCLALSDLQTQLMQKGAKRLSTQIKKPYSR